jgi:hypothetical protein
VVLRRVPDATTSNPLRGIVDEFEEGGKRRQDAPPLFATREDPDGDFNGAVADPEVVVQAWAAWRREVENADRFVAATPDLLSVAMADPDRGPLSLRWVLVHMIEEYAQHIGHADLLRQLIDGRVGQ